MTPPELKARSKEFALRILKLTAALPKTIQGRAIANQLVRSGTSVAGNKRVRSFLHEGTELIAILVASRKSASANLKSKI